MAPDLASDAVFCAPALASFTAAITRSSVALAPPRTSEAVRRACLGPVDDGRGRDLPRTRSATSCAAVTPPWARPLTVAPTLSTTAAPTPATRLPGGVSGERGCGRVGAVSRAEAMASPSSVSAFRPSSERTSGKYSVSSSSTWWRTFSMSTVTLATKRSSVGSMPSSSESSHLTTWCSSRLSSAVSSTAGTVARVTG